MADKGSVVLRLVGEPVRINPDLIPEHQLIELAKWAIELTEKVFSIPGEEERYQAWLAERNRKTT